MVGDRTMIEGWTKALPTMYVGERAIFRITDSDTLGYGEQGVPPIVPPNAVIELDIEMLDSKTLSFDIDFDALESSGVPVRVSIVIKKKKFFFGRFVFFSSFFFPSSFLLCLIFTSFYF